MSCCRISYYVVGNKRIRFPRKELSAFSCVIDVNVGTGVLVVSIRLFEEYVSKRRRTWRRAEHLSDAMINSEKELCVFVSGLSCLRER